jgi:hypothetical protein
LFQGAGLVPELEEDGMDEKTSTELRDDEMVTEIVGSSASLETPPRDADGTDADGTDGDGTDGTDGDGTDADGTDADGTDGDATDGTDGDGTDADGTDSATS